MNFPHIHTLNKTSKLIVVCFLVTLSLGYISGLRYISITSGFNSQGIEENYLGNENNEDAEVMKFEKTERDILSVVHSHTIIYSFIFLALGALLSLTSYNERIKRLLILEPFCSIVLTFGGIWLMWAGWAFLKYVVIISGCLLTISFFLSTILILVDLFRSREH